jgi:beta-fructofuranosidase
MDYTFSGNGIGLYTASAVVALQHSVFHSLPDPQGEYASPEEAQAKTI